MKLQHYLGGLEGLDGPLDFEKRVFVEDWERRIFGIHVALMGLSSSLRDALPGGNSALSPAGSCKSSASVRAPLPGDCVAARFTASTVVSS